MEQYNKNMGTQPEAPKNKFSDRRPNGRVWAGAIVLVVGGVLLAREAGADIPRWVISWEMGLVALGLFMGVRCNFRNWTFMIPLGIGLVNLSERIFWHLDIKEFIWPTIIIIIGLVMIFRPRRKKNENWGGNWRQHMSGVNTETTYTGTEDIIDTVSVFGSVKKTILSKNFRGGEVTNFFGGTELNLTQADITTPITLEMTQVFGGAKLIVPANWTVQSAELVSIFGGVDDKRMIQPTAVDPNKVLILRGTNIFGGLEIKSY